ncbi:unnamed protein product [Clavelina lepadiformis]|uniref:Uncharacterized protein n=1 Tax=Clavelina lepadiformis TaxID=159417 RepID=A0ABP0GZ04_CLALP
MNKMLFFVGLLLLVSLTEVSSLNTRIRKANVRYGLSHANKINTETRRKLVDANNRVARSIAEYQPRRKGLE